ncbi:MAG: alpha/beta hydrolase [Halioglobus sp.]
MKSIDLGRKAGRLVVYFHGAPGAVQEGLVFDGLAKKYDLRIVCFDRFSVDKTLGKEGYYQLLADHIETLASGKQVVLIGFSIGSYVALEVAGILGDRVSQVHLISAVAPITGGDFLDSMAGSLVFKLARDKPSAFFLLTQCQRVLAVLAPSVLLKMLFSSAAGADKELIAQKSFQSHIAQILRECFQEGATGYMRDINFYVTWHRIPQLRARSVSIWHGSADNWSPVAMTEYLSSTLSCATHVEVMNGLSHYSCLQEAAPLICASLGKMNESE